jgi:hypothetical protein
MCAAFEVVGKNIKREKTKTSIVMQHIEFLSYLRI